MKVQRLTAIEVVVPARAGAINSAGLDRPLNRIPTPGHPAWTVQFDALPKLILRAELDNGVVAWGECHRGHDWEALPAIVAWLVEADLDSLHRGDLGLPRGPERVGFECLILDGLAKSAGLPVVELLGGRARDAVPVAAWSGHRTPEDAGQLAAQFEALGYGHLKLKCDLRDDTTAIATAAAAAAPSMRLTLDPNERWREPAEALRRLAALEAIGNVQCVEDPIPRAMLDDYRNLREQVSIPLALHIALHLRNEEHDVGDAINAIRADAVDAFNVTAGPAEFLRLAHVAAAADLPCWVGSGIDLGILEAMSVHMACAAPGTLWPSDIFGRLIRTHDMLEEPLRLDPPLVHLPDGPGLGVQPDEAVLEQYGTRTEELFAQELVTR